MRIVKYIFPYFIIFGSLSFTIITTIIGYQYQVHSRIYLYYNIIVAISGYLYFCYKILLKKFRLSNANYIALVFIVFIILSFPVSRIIFDNTATIAFNFWSYMLIWSIPAFLYGLIFSKSNGLAIVWRGADIFMIIITFVVGINAVYYYIYGLTSASVSGSTTYQTMSYLSALAIGLNYYLLINKNNKYRPRIFQKSFLYKTICVFFLLIQALSLVVTGGRGGMVLAVIYFFVITFFTRNNINKHIKMLVVFCVIILLVFLLTTSDSRIDGGISRIFEFLDKTGINWNGTSGRDLIYSKAIDLIQDSPIFGYGIWGLFTHIENPHNLFLELLLGGGIFLLLIGVIFLFIVLLRYLSIRKIEGHYALLFIFFLYNFVMLMFSGTYLCAPTAWFFIGFIFSFNLKKQRNLNRHDLTNTRGL